MKRKDNNRFFPFVYGIAGFLYTAVAGALNFLVNPDEISWVNLLFTIPMILFSVFTLYMCTKIIKDVKPKDIYLPPILFSALFLVGSYCFTLIYPDMFLTQAYWSLLALYTATAISIVIITVIPKIPRKRFVILSYLGVVILEGYGIVGAVYNCFNAFALEGGTLSILLIIRENILG